MSANVLSEGRFAFLLGTLSHTPVQSGAFGAKHAKKRPGRPNPHADKGFHLCSPCAPRATASRVPHPDCAKWCKGSQFLKKLIRELLWHATPKSAIVSPLPGLETT